MQTKYMQYIRYSFSMLMLFVLGAGLLFTSCEDDDDENESKVELLSYGPMPVARGGELRFIGNNLDKVTSVVIPDGIEIASADFTSRSTDLITVTVPQTAVEGLVVLKTSEGDITTKTPIGFSEPISIDEFAPASIKPGDILTIKGDYLNLVKEVIFTDRVVAIDSVSFESQSRKELQVVVPDGAQTGIIGVSDGAEDPIIIYTEETLDVVLPSFAEENAFTTDPVKAGEELTISGSNLDVVRKVEFSGDQVVESDDFVSQTESEIVVVIPAAAHDGTIAIMPGSGLEIVSVEEIELMVPTITGFNVNPVKPGTLLRALGEDLDLVTQVVFGAVSQTEIVVISDTEIEFTVPVDAPGGVLGFVTAAEKEVTSSEELQMIMPSISELAPDAAPAGDTVRLGGENLDLVASVTFTGGVNVEAEYDESKDSVYVAVPNGAENGPLTVVAKNSEEVVTTQSFTFISINVPVINSIPGAVMPGSLLVIEGEKLDLLTDVIFPGDITATMFGNKSATLLEVYVPENVTMGKGIITFVTVDGETTTSPEISFGVDPITPETIIVNDYEPHGGHDGSWDSGWSGGTEITTEDGNTFLKVVAQIAEGWVINCNHQANGAPGPVIENIENYVLKFDIRIDEGVTGAENAQMQVVLGDGWHWFGPGFFPASTNGGWMTVEIPVSALGLSGKVDMSSGTNGIYGGVVPAGISLDNLRFDPK
ncbi:glycan-binding surface protein [Marinilabilia salmonicolor]|uniref:Surface glycan-binding protein B xyloglucan binding domain-containing protein n=1 Tax=Marinilabilia salmonicolor TaxID=989 RepID=A0A368VHX1_9BACT|nr:glycan-binding surface protein [Marinilabilia salmonicolor]RCW39244.1 hypothetical protein DFO77_10112 [Marinilabilia salmonicolor]